MTEKRNLRTYRLLCHWRLFVPVYMNAESLDGAVARAKQLYELFSPQFPIPASHEADDDVDFDVVPNTPAWVREGRFKLMLEWVKSSVAKVEARSLIDALRKLEQDSCLPPIEVPVDSDFSTDSFLVLQCDPFAGRELAEEDHGKLEPLGAYSRWPKSWPKRKADARAEQVYAVAAA